MNSLLYYFNRNYIYGKKRVIPVNLGRLTKEESIQDVMLSENTDTDSDKNRNGYEKY